MEDDFDGQNRMNLQHFIRPNDEEGEYPQSYYYTQNQSEDINNKAMEQRKEILRIPTLALFHKLVPGKGVPHTFVGEFAFVGDYREINSRPLE